MLTSIKLQLHNISFCFLLTHGLDRPVCQTYSCQTSTVIIYKRQFQTSLLISMNDGSFIKMQITLYLQHGFSNTLLTSSQPTTIFILSHNYTFFPGKKKKNYISTLMLQCINKSGCKAICNTQPNLY